MKIRTDYVTNSSSSSFILGFKSKEEIAGVANQLPYYWSEDVKDNIVSDIERGITSKDAAVDFYKEHIWEHFWKFRGKDWFELTREERESPEYKTFVDNRKKSLAQELINGLNENEIISIVEYEDHTMLGSELEHDVMPRLSCTIERISHH